MINSEKYNLLTESEIKMESNMAIIPRNGQTNFFSESYIRKSLSSRSEIKLEQLTQNEDIFNAKITFRGVSYSVDIYTINTSDLNLQNYGFANHIDDESFRIARLQKICICVSLYFGSDNLESFLLQLKLLDSLCPSASLVIDFISYRLLSPHWLSMTAKSDIPPSPDYLYTLHCVFDEKEDGERRYWFHTHGMLRCGSVELEMLNIGKGYEQMNVLINTTVKKFLTSPSKECERFTIGYDGMGINLCWLRWEEAIKQFPPDILGGISDRKGEDNVHTDAGGVLFAAEDGNMISPEIYAPTLAVNPIYYISTEETNRMSALAKERYDLFLKIYKKNYISPGKRNIFKKWFRKNNDEQYWAFLVKLGLTVDNAQSWDEREHLWFEVLSSSERWIKCKLLNQPYWITELSEGDIREYPVELLTDWVIYAPGTSYTPDTIYELMLNS